MSHVGSICYDLLLRMSLRPSVEAYSANSCCGPNSRTLIACKQIIDGIWRFVIGSGAVPALLATIFPFFLYNCGLYQLKVELQICTLHERCHFNSLKRISIITSSATETGINLLGELDAGSSYPDNRGPLGNMWASTEQVPLDSRLSCWNSTLSGENSTIPDRKHHGLPNWAPDATMPCNAIHDVLLKQAKQYLPTVSTSSIAGSVCFILFANRLPRKQRLAVSSIVLAILFTITGGIYYGVAYTPRAPATVVFLAICTTHFAPSEQQWKRRPGSMVSPS
ncbi:hypothetical protein BJ170DRAFT_727760 [Xylariales sp. AK1849]|nr:hypothetical protein BJ170DRAFT_727760 [Xylariales sp. AK1849]